MQAYRSTEGGSTGKYRKIKCSRGGREVKFSSVYDTLFKAHFEKDRFGFPLAGQAK